MSRIFEGNCSVVLNTVGKVVVKADPEGKYNATNVDELAKFMVDQAKAHNAELGFFAPEGKFGTKGTAPVLLAGRGGQPYVAVLPERKTNATPRKKVVKLG